MLGRNMVIFVWTVLAVTPLAFAWRQQALRRQDRWALHLVLAFIICLDYLLRLFQIAWTGLIGWDRANIRAISASDYIQLVGVFLAVLCCLLFGSIITPGRRGQERKHIYLRRGRARLSAELLGALGLILVLVASTGFLPALGGLQGRQNFGSGIGYAMGQVAVPTILAMSAMWSVGMVVPTRLTVAAGVAFISLHLLFLGGRVEVATLLIGVGAIIAARVRVGPILLTGLLLGASFAAALYRSATRETGTGSSGSIGAPLDFLTRGDVSGADKIAVASTNDVLGHAKGETYLAAFRSLLGASQDALGGNQYFTQLVDPARYARGRTYEGVSLFGEALMNFGFLGLMTVALSLGYLVGRTQINSTSIGGLFRYGLLAGALPSLMRSDLLNSIFTFVPMLVVGSVLIRLNTREVANSPLVDAA